MNAESGFQPSPSNALNCMALLVLVQAPDRMFLSSDSCYWCVVQSRQRLWGPIVDAAEPRPSQGTHSLLFCLSVAKPLEPTFTARLSRKTKNYKWKTRAVKWRQLCVTFFSSFLPSETGRLRKVIFSLLDEYIFIFRFPRLFLLQHEAVFFHMQQSFSSSLEEAMVPLLFQAYYPNRCQYATG